MRGNPLGGYSPELDKSKAIALEWLVKPKDRKDVRTFSHINPGAPYIFSAYIETMNFRKQLMESELVYECSTHDTFHLEDTITKDCKLTGTIDCNIEKTIEDDQAKAFVEDILLLSPAVNGRRANMTGDMLKNMNRPSGMGNLMGLFGNEQSDEEDALPMDPPDED